jgi:hypothetical protein
MGLSVVTSKKFLGYLQERMMWREKQNHFLDEKINEKIEMKTFSGSRLDIQSD